MQRRSFLGGLGGILAAGFAPAAVGSGILMPIKKIIPFNPWALCIKDMRGNVIFGVRADYSVEAHQGYISQDKVIGESIRVLTCNYPDIGGRKQDTIYIRTNEVLMGGVHQEVRRRPNLYTTILGGCHGPS